MNCFKLLKLQNLSLKVKLIGAKQQLKNLRARGRSERVQRSGRGGRRSEGGADRARRSGRKSRSGFQNSRNVINQIIAQNQRVNDAFVHAINEIAGDPRARAIARGLDVDQHEREEVQFNLSDESGEVGGNESGGNGTVSIRDELTRYRLIIQAQERDLAEHKVEHRQLNEPDDGYYELEEVQGAVQRDDEDQNELGAVQAGAERDVQPDGDVHPNDNVQQKGDVQPNGNVQPELSFLVARDGVNESNRSYSQGMCAN